MTTTAMTRTLEIDGMSGDGCVQKVGAALRGVAGVTTHTVKLGTATFDADQSAYDAARAAVGAAGYRNRGAGLSAPVGRVAASPNGAAPAAKAVGAPVGARVGEVKGAEPPAAERAAPGSSAAGV